MLYLNNEEAENYLNSVKEFADKIGMRKQLEEKLSYLDTYADHNKEGLTRCILWQDFAPQSFNFLIQKKNGNDWVRWFNGGLIFHGAHDGGGNGGAPTFSVNLTPMNGWQIHT